jgi:hypothetical protein
VKLFQIEEPEGGSPDPDAPGAAIGIDASGTGTEVAVSVGGNAVVLTDREGFERALPVPAAPAATQWRELFEGARLRAERALARPVSHAVIVLAEAPGEVAAAGLIEAADQAGLAILRIAAAGELPTDAALALAAATLAEDLAPRPEPGAAPGADLT